MEANSPPWAEARNSLARFNADGTLDASFAHNVSLPINCILVQPDGKILVGGLIGVLRLNPDGSRDAGFSPVPDGKVNGIALQPDGKILVVGTFLNIGGRSSRFVARLNANGTLDPSFLPPSLDNHPETLALQSDGKVLLGGVFISVGGVTRHYIARLNTDGTLDLGFDANVSSNLGTAVHCLAIQADGRILLGGSLDCVTNSAPPRVIFVSPAGTPQNYIKVTNELINDWCGFVATRRRHLFQTWQCHRT